VLYIALYEKLSFIAFAFATVDGAAIMYLSWNTLRMSNLDMNVTILYSYISWSHMKELDVSLGQMLKVVQCRKINNDQMILERKLAHFRMEQRHYQHILQFCNRDIADLMFLAFLTNLLTNVVMFNMFILEELSLNERIIVGFVIAIQIVMSIFAGHQQIQWSSSLYISEKKMYRAQIVLSQIDDSDTFRRSICSRLKLMHFIESICARKKIYTRVGPLGKISKMAAFEV